MLDMLFFQGELHGYACTVWQAGYAGRRCLFAARCYCFVGSDISIHSGYCCPEANSMGAVTTIN